jgi:hypothetical protein
MAVDFSQWEESDAPLEDHGKFEWRLLRTPTSKIIKVAFVNARHYGLYKHHWKRSTYPHLREGCPACAAGNECRWYGYVLALLSPTREHVVFEFTAGAAESVLKAIRDYHTLRGLVVLASRPNKRDNGAVLLSFSGERLPESELPADVPCRPICARIWGHRDESRLPAESTDFSDPVHGGSTLRPSRDVGVPSNLPVDPRPQDLPGQMRMLWPAALASAGNGSS